MDKRVEILYKCRETSTNPPFLCKTNPIFLHFSTKNNDSTKKQTQYKANSKPNKANFGPKTKVGNENKPNSKLVLDWCLLAFLSGTQNNPTELGEVSKN